MQSSTEILGALGQGPPLVATLIAELPAAERTWRPRPGKWSAHEHAAHLARMEPMWAGRAERILIEDHPTIISYEPDVDEAPDALLHDDLPSALDALARGRAALRTRLASLPESVWDRPATHTAHGRYSLRLMLRHVVLHDHLHAYRIEEILLRRQVP
jgi:uncharacterized damage-inducible protein DinB